MPVSTAAIAAVNHWRGQCLDNFARAEKAIIVALCEPEMATLPNPPKIHEAAANRTRDLASTLRHGGPKSAATAKTAALLEHWGLREKQRNHLVHGCFAVKGSCDQDWSLVNETIEIKKGVAVTTRTPMTQIEAAAFLQAVISERKELEQALKALKGLPS